jgi:hypothetical protein
MYKYLNNKRSLENKILAFNLASLNVIEITAELRSDNYGLPVSLPIPGIALAT